MDSAEGAAPQSNSTSRDNYLRQLNKLSQKISKPATTSTTVAKKPNPFEAHQNQNPTTNANNNSLQLSSQHQNLQHQPPVYNINKNDFRDVVQKLTGSPAHERISTPPPIHQPRPPSSRLQRIRPPPLPQIANRPPSMLRPHQMPPPQPTVNAAGLGGFSGFGRPAAPPLSPLPPLPAVHAAAESPVSAYLRYLHGNNVDQSSKHFSGFSPLQPLVSPRWNSFNPPQPQPQSQHQPQSQSHPQPESKPQPQVASEQESQPPPQQIPLTHQAVVPSEAPPPPQPQPQPTVTSQAQFPFPSPPSPFGCLNSPFGLSSYPLLSPGLLFSPNSGQLGFPQLPLSPTVPVPSPRWRGL
ncbi:hypothetical protein HN51_018516 [Arachis hypogaea]|uniref:VQ motif-containing protein 9 n=1 Tax=Arachis duranensis TaxID=130453 RepID=A0A6P4B1W8_ARADU|nr:VQ motif-containing protein 9 [Arachis duranensis]XP_025613152.1 VQ motif-containing protein 9 [Arachis hypogaea]QHO30113.1 VQ motif-containing protein [Arachis hypogaea]